MFSQRQVDNGVTFGVTDQLALNMLLEEGTEAELLAAPEDARATLHRRGALRLHPLPVALFPSGHVAFVQRLPWRWAAGASCRAQWGVHACGLGEHPARACPTPHPCPTHLAPWQVGPAAVRGARHLPALRHRAVRLRQARALPVRERLARWLAATRAVLARRQRWAGLQGRGGAHSAACSVHAPRAGTRLC